jgi:hypothetical protein
VNLPFKLTHPGVGVSPESLAPEVLAPVPHRFQNLDLWEADAPEEVGALIKGRGGDELIPGLRPQPGGFEGFSLAPPRVC